MELRGGSSSSARCHNRTREKDVTQATFRGGASQNKHTKAQLVALDVRDAPHPAPKHPTMCQQAQREHPLPCSAPAPAPNPQGFGEGLSSGTASQSQGSSGPGRALAPAPATLLSVLPTAGGCGTPRAGPRWIQGMKIPISSRSWWMLGLGAGSRVIHSLAVRKPDAAHF